MNIFHINPDNLCETFKLCSVRKYRDEYFVGRKDLKGTISEIPFSDIANSNNYKMKPLIRTYSSGHIFIDDTQTKVYLITTKKDERIQHQFTGGSPIEEINKNVFFQIDGTVKVRLDSVEDNAEIRTFNRTGVKVTETYNEIPLVDWVLMEGRNENGESFWKLVCLMHYIVKGFEGILSHKDGVEYVIDGNWYDIDDLPNIQNVAPNAYLVTKKALEVIGKN